MQITTILLAAALWGAVDQSAAPLWVQLGPTNETHGLTVPSQGDGTNEPDNLAGSPCRRLTGDRSLYLYVQAAAVVPGTYDAYVAVEYLDEGFGQIRAQYDRAPLDRQKNSLYAGSPDSILLLGSGRWQRAVLHLPDARFGHGQNFQADFRLNAPRLAVRRIEVLWSRPADYSPGGTPPAAVEKLRTHIGPGMELCFGNDAQGPTAQLLRALGTTSVESYVTWQTVEDTGENQWDWSRWDRQVEALREAHLKWVPFLIAGPGYATPRWYRESDRSVPYVCLEHGAASKIQSLWNPAFRPWVERFIRAFAERYRESGVIESVLLGVSGTYGETLYPAGPADGWTYVIPGPFHNHRGWWAGDQFAIASFQQHVKQRYKQLAALNRAWQTNYTTWEDVRPLLPEKAPSLVARSDMAQWYLESMTDWAAFWVATARKYFPQTPLYLCVGGAGEPEIGADFSAQAKAVAPYGCRLRITNEGSDYARNFVVTREVASACRALGLDFGFEPASRVSASGNVARIYNATASGAIQLHCYNGNLFEDAGSLDLFHRWIPQLARRTPVTHLAVWIPKTSWNLDSKAHAEVFGPARLLRDRVDFELLDRMSLAEPWSRNIPVLAIPYAAYADDNELATLRQWVAAGGILIARAPTDGPLLRTPAGSDDLRRELLAAGPHDASLLQTVSEGSPPRRFVLEIGKPGDEPYLVSGWFGSENGGMFGQQAGLRMRWSTEHAKLLIPCHPQADSVLLLRAVLPGSSRTGRNRVLVNGQEVGQIDKPGNHLYRFAVPAAVLAARSSAEVAFHVEPYRPKEHGANDARTLGIALNHLEMLVGGAEQAPPEQTRLTTRIDWSQAPQLTRRLGRGVTLLTPPCSADRFNDLLIAVLKDPGRLLPGAPPIALPSTAADGVFATQCGDGILYYNSKDRPQTVDGLEIPAQGITRRTAKQ